MEHDRLREAFARRREEAQQLREEAPRTRAMAQGAALVNRAVPPALRAKFPLAALPEEVRVRTVALVDELEAAATDAGETVVLNLLSRAERAEARAKCLDELCAEVEALLDQAAAEAARVAPADPFEEAERERLRALGY